MKMARIIMAAFLVLGISLQAMAQSAGPDQTICKFVLVTMAAQGTGTWSVAGANPAATTFVNATDPSTGTFGFSNSGTYTFAWTSGGVPDTMTVTVIDADIASITASPDSIIATGQSATLAALTDVPGGSYQWSPAAFITPVSGHPETIIGTPNTTMSFCLTYTVSGCQTTKCQTIYVRSVYAGADQTACQYDVATMAASGTGTWSALTGNPATAVLSNPSDPNTTVSGLFVPGTYSFIWTSGSSTDTAAVHVNAKPNAGPDQTVFSPSLPGGTATMAATATGTWTADPGNPGTATITTSSSPTTTITSFSAAGSYAFIWTSNGCTDTVAVSVLLSSVPDSVWPGDADHNGIADNNDLLPIGVAYGLNGFARADQSIIWTAHYTQDWGVQFLNGTNTKHADCNGDGVINADDTLAIIQNFGLTHAKTNSASPWRSGLAGLKTVLSADSLYQGDTLTVTFILGDAILPANNIYGLAWTYNFNPLVVDSTFTTISFGNSWLGSTDKISIGKTLNSQGHVKAAITRTDHTTRSGNGAIAKVSFKITTDNISGKDLVYYTNTGFISDLTAINEHGTPIPLNAGADTSQVGYTPTSINEIATEKVSLHPNPAQSKVTVAAASMITEVAIINVAGQEVRHIAGLNSKIANIDIATLEEGMYFIQIKTDIGAGTTKLSVVR